MIAPLLTVSEVASILRVAPCTVYRMVDDGRLPHVRLGTTIRFKPEDLPMTSVRAKAPEIKPAKPARQEDGYQKIAREARQGRAAQ